MKSEFGEVMKKTALSIMSILIFSQILFAQNVEDYLNDIVQDESASYMKSYLQPFSTALSTAMGSALYHRAYTKGFPRIDIGINVAYVIIPDEDKTFKDESGSEVATIFGSIPSDIRGFDKGALAIPYLQANIGLITSLEATARFTKLNVNYLGDITIYGLGLKYDLSDMVPLNLIDLSAQAIYHKFALGNIMDAGAFSMNLQASVGIPVLPIDIYGGLGFDNSTLEIETEKLDNPDHIGNVRIDGENSVRFNVGLSYTLMVFNLHADYNISEYNSIGAGLMIVL